MARASKRSTRSALAPVGLTARQLLRAIGGGLLVGLPLLYTMEMWFHSFLLPSWKIVALLVVAFVVVIGYNAVSGFRHERTRRELLVDSVNTMGIAAVVAMLALLVLGRIGPDSDLREAIGKVALEMIPVSFGVSLAGTQLAAGSGEDEDEDEDEDEPIDDQDEEALGSPDTDRPVGAFGRLFVAAGAALLFALNVAPTEEPALLGIEADWWLLLLVVAASLAMTLAIVFYADFRGGRAPERGGGVLDHPWSETLIAYAISLAISLLLMWSFGRTDGMSASAVAGQTIMLAFVASFGAAAGRLLVGGRRTGAKASGGAA